MIEEFKKFLLEAVANFKPIQVHNEIKDIKELNIGGTKYSVENGEIVLGGEKSKIQLIKGTDGLLRLHNKNTNLEGISDQADENVNMLDNQEKIFTRSDLAEIQLELLNIDEKHEEIIKIMRPVLAFHKGGNDIGALIASSAIIQAEEKKEDFDLVKRMSSKLQTCYSSRGAMIYNLFRSEILENEILPHLEKLKRVYDVSEEVNLNFLIYWDGIIEKGYPTAHFVTTYDTEKTLLKEIKWRLERGVKNVVLYSRTTRRNSDTEEKLKIISANENYTLGISDIYELGFTAARKFTISENIQLES